MKLFITNKSSFYKNELFNRINAEEKIVVIFTSRNAMSSSRNSDFVSGEKNFEFYHLDARASKYARVLQILRITRKYLFREVVFSGWTEKEQVICMFLFRKRINALICESSVFESKYTGLVGLKKRFVLSRISKVYCPGEANKRLIENLHFQGSIIITGGCGILRYVSQPPYEPRNEVKNFLYVGRLVRQKNLRLLVEVLNELPKLNLTIIGEGPQAEELRSMAKGNVAFAGYVNNADLPEYYRSHDVFVLPSLSETWGLVVEEALNNGMPVIVSDHVGCRYDLVTEQTGEIFKFNEKDSLLACIEAITEVSFYNKLRQGVSSLNFQHRSQMQVNAFL